MTEKVVPFRRPIRWENLRADEAETIIRTRALKTENVIFTTHAYVRKESRSILHADVFRILREGFVDSPPERDKNGAWKVKIKKRVRGTREAGVVTAIVKDSHELIVVTIMWIDPK